MPANPAAGASRPASYPELRLANARLHDLTFDQISGEAARTIAEKKGPLFIVTLDIIGSYKSLFDAEYRRAIEDAGIVTCDGSGMKLLTMLRYPRHIVNKVSGVDLAARLLDDASAAGYRAAFIGAKQEVVAMLAETVSRRWPGLGGTYFHHGYFTPAERSSVIERLVRTRPEIILFGLGNPAQEKLINSIKRLFPGSVMIGVGGSFDVMSGRLSRAPLFMQKACLEWLYRLWQEPSRFTRMLCIPKYIAYVMYCEVKRWMAGR